MLQYVDSSLIHNEQKLETTHLSLDRRMDTKNVVHYTMEYYSDIKKEDIINFKEMWMELENNWVILSDVTQTQKDHHFLKHRESKSKTSVFTKAQNSRSYISRGHPSLAPQKSKEELEGQRSSVLVPPQLILLKAR